MKTAIAAAVLAVAAASGANAAVLFSQDFNSLPEGIPAASIPGFTIAGTVDVVANGNYSITCVGNTGACVDIDGTPGPGALTSDPIAFAAGNLVTVSFDVSGNQRDANTDEFDFSFAFAGPTDMLGFSCSSGFSSCAPGNYLGFTASGIYVENILGTRPWLTYSFSFTPGQAGTIALNFSSPSADNVGPMLDNVFVSQVPEPASWAMLIAGFGLVGAAARRRRMTAVAG